MISTHTIRYISSVVGQELTAGETQNLICKKYAESGSLRKTAEVFGVSHTSVKMWLVSWGIEIGKRGGNNAPAHRASRRTLYFRYRGRVMPISELMRWSVVSKSTLRSRLRRGVAVHEALFAPVF